MNSLKCLIVDDEKLAQELLETYIEKVPFLELEASCFTAMEAMPYLVDQKIDILFLDIQMPDLNGIDFLRSLEKQPETIFTTAYSEYAIEGFNLSIVDYLLKPIEFDRFFSAVSKSLKLLQPPSIPSNQSQEETEKANNDYFFIKADNRIVRVEYDTILFVEALQKYIRIYMTDKKIMSLLSLSKIEEMMPADRFIRTHRSFIINIDKIESIEGNQIKIKEHTLPISKGQKETFINALRKKGLFN